MPRTANIDAADRTPRILFVDDEPEVRRAVARTLNRQSLSVDVASSGLDAIRMARRNPYAVIATDLKMPGMDGLSLIERLRATSRGTTFLLVTGMSASELRNTVPLDAPILQVIAKPWDERTLVAACREALRVSSIAPSAGLGELLLVEDNPDDACLIADYLREAFGDEYQVRSVTTLTEALVFLQVSNVQVVVADLGRPDALALDGVRRLSAACPAAPLVVLSDVRNDDLALEAVARGAQDFLDKSTLDPERLKHAISFAIERQRASKRLAELAHHDQLTGLANRTLFLERLDHAVALAQRSGANFAVMFLDLDKFKPINDSYGHDAGDTILQEVALRLSTAVRACDTVARIGGDEFALILENVTGERQVSQVVDRIQRALAPTVQVGAQEIRSAASIGVALGMDGGETADQLLRAADAAMYRAKQTTGTSCEFYLPQAYSGRMPRLQLQNDLRAALGHDEFLLFYQPQHCLRSQRTVAIEALLRWKRSDGRIMLPSEFISVLEDSGLIVSAGDWVIRTACAQLQQLMASGSDLRVAVNVSAVQFESEDFVETVRAALDDTGLPAAQLELEITESVLMRDTARVNRTLCELKALGLRLAIDDFGTGYSSLAYLSRFRVDALKIDQTFTQQMDSDTSGASVASAIISLGHELGLEVVAEGVERAEQLAFLRRNGCDLVQGYLIGEPNAHWPPR
jgi:diguanylate cyclase (GGDEF)-like protein